MSLRTRGGGSIMSGDIWLQWFSCCVNSQSHQKAQASDRRRRDPQRPRIDRTMIGLPTNFQHTGHIGSSDVALATDRQHLSALQTQMQSKGGYDMAIRVF